MQLSNIGIMHLGAMFCSKQRRYSIQKKDFDSKSSHAYIPLGFDIRYEQHLPLTLLRQPIDGGVSWLSDLSMLLSFLFYHERVFIPLILIQHRKRIHLDSIAKKIMAVFNIMS